MSTIQLLRPAHALEISALRRRPHTSRSRSTSVAMPTQVLGRQPSRAFATARLAHALELTGACAVIAVFLAVALFV